MTFDEFMRKMLDTFPAAEVGEDFDGQLIVYTGLRTMTSNDNPSIPEGEEFVVRLDGDEFPV